MRPLEGVRDLRERRMLSQQELADRAGVSLFTVQRIERGEGSVRPKTGRAIAAALGVGVEDLLGKAQAPLPLEFSAEEAAAAAAAGRSDAIPELLSDLMGRYAEDFERELLDPGSKRFRTVDAALDWVDDVNRHADIYLDFVRDRLQDLQPPTDGLFDVRLWRNTFKLVGHAMLTFREITRRARKRIEAMAEAPDELAARRSAQERLAEAEAAADERQRRVREMSAEWMKAANA